MKPVVFVGPTLSLDPVRGSRDFLWRPPAGEGDLYRATRLGPSIIALIDGQFEAHPSVWHKEILWALANGIHVFGAASMGALRAAELDRFGMIGTGAIYRDYRDGRLEDDDEVAVLHAAKDVGYRPLSEALVDIRATLDAAKTAGVISRRSALHLARNAKDIFFKERTWPLLLRSARRAGVSDTEIARLRRWLRTHRVERKREDARALLELIRAFARTRPEPLQPNFAFEHTAFWRALIERHKGNGAGTSGRV